MTYTRFIRRRATLVATKLVRVLRLCFLRQLVAFRRGYAHLAWGETKLTIGRLCAGSLRTSAITLQPKFAQCWNCRISTIECDGAGRAGPEYHRPVFAVDGRQIDVRRGRYGLRDGRTGRHAGCLAGGRSGRNAHFSLTANRQDIEKRRQYGGIEPRCGRGKLAPSSV